MLLIIQDEDGKFTTDFSQVKVTDDLERSSFSEMVGLKRLMDVGLRRKKTDDHKHRQRF